MDANKKFWERTARFYGPIQERSNRALYEAVAEHCAPYLTRESEVLELACGSGQLTVPLWRKAGRWKATDYSEKMIAQARRRCPEGVAFSVEDAGNLPDPDESYDLVLMANALHIMPEPEKALKEIRRVLRPGGVLLAPTFVYEGKVNRLRMKLTELLGFETFHSWDLAGLRAYLEEAGFEAVEVSLLPGDPLPEGFYAGRKKPE